MLSNCGRECPEGFPWLSGAAARCARRTGERKTIAGDLGISRQTLYDILAERQPVTPPMAVRPAAMFGDTPEVWLRMQAAHDLWHARRTVDTSAIPKIATQ